MTAETIDSTTNRLDLLAHLDACPPCASLFALAREPQDLDALDAWRRQLAQHMTADRERGHHQKHVHRVVLGDSRCRSRSNESRSRSGPRWASAPNSMTTA